MADSARILIADDEEMFLNSTASLLRKKGYKCDCATSAKLATKMLSQKEYDLLISDIYMPGNSGFELIRYLTKYYEGLPVFLVTGYPSMRAAAYALELPPVVGYFTKPIDFNKLFEKMKETIQNYRIYRTVRGAGKLRQGEITKNRKVGH
jgi:DNA-binding NtrC family response regulator